MDKNSPGPSAAIGTELLFVLKCAKWPSCGYVRSEPLRVVHPCAQVVALVWPALGGRRLALAHLGDQVAVHDALADHGIAPDFLGEDAVCRLDAQRLDVQGNTAFGLLLAVGSELRRDRAEHGDVHHGLSRR
jgi:hypothetical protein